MATKADTPATAKLSSSGVCPGGDGGNTLNLFLLKHTGQSEQERARTGLLGGQECLKGQGLLAPEKKMLVSTGPEWRGIKTGRCQPPLTHASVSLGHGDKLVGTWESSWSSMRESLGLLK